MCRQLVSQNTVRKSVPAAYLTNVLTLFPPAYRGMLRRRLIRCGQIFLYTTENDEQLPTQIYMRSDFSLNNVYQVLSGIIAVKRKI